MIDIDFSPTPEPQPQEKEHFPKYVILPYAGFVGFSGILDSPDCSNTVSSLKAAKVWFKTWLYETNNDYRRRLGYTQPWADIYLSKDWDGVSYGDIMYGRLSLGINGGIFFERAC